MQKASLKFRKGDLLAVGLVLAAAVLSGALVYGICYQKDPAIASIYQNGELRRRVPLDVDQTFQLHGDYTNTVTVRDGKIAVTDSDCPTKDCMHMGWIDHGSIICLPNGVEIRVESDTDVDFVVQ